MSNAQESFPGLSPHGNYESDSVPPKGVSRLPLDGSIRIAKSLGIPYVDIVSVECAYGSTYLPRRVGYAIPSRDKRKFSAALKRCDSKRVSRTSQPHPDLLLCIREASRAAHRERDAASNAYNEGRHTLAGNSRQRKNKWYALKDRGIVAAHKQGLVALHRCIAAGLGCLRVRRRRHELLPFDASPGRGRARSSRGAS